MPPVGELDQILLQRRDAEGVLDFIIFEFAVGAVGVSEKLAVALEKPRGDPGIGELGIVEVAEHAIFVRLLHGALMMRPAPRVVNRVMTTLAVRRANVGCDHYRRWRGRCRAAPAQLERQVNNQPNRNQADNGKQADAYSPTVRVIPPTLLCSRRLVTLGCFAVGAALAFHLRLNFSVCAVRRSALANSAGAHSRSIPGSCPGRCLGQLREASYRNTDGWPALASVLPAPAIRRTAIHVGRVSPAMPMILIFIILDVPEGASVALLSESAQIFCTQIG